MNCWWWLRSSYSVVSNSTRLTSRWAILVLLFVAFSIFISTGQRKITSARSNACASPAIFNFGDSNSDTGSMSAAFHRVTYPNGFSFFDLPSGRYCDGRLIIDFIAEKLGLPYLSPYLDSIGSNFKHGVNFAASGSTIQPADGRIFGGGFSPISLDIQILQFEQFKERTIELYNQGKKSWYLPKPNDFSKSLYTLDIGQNDLHAGFMSMTEKQIVESLPNIIGQFSQAVEKLYILGARAFWIHNTGPIGCIPYDVITYPPKPEDRDQNGCSKSHNEIAQEFNRQLKDKVFQLRKQFSDAAFTYTDVYTAKYSLISEAKKHGFDNPLGYCCGHYWDYRVECDKNVMVNGTEAPYLCSKPEHFISWDGIHYSQAANEKVADTILDGSHSDPSIPISEACHQLFRLPKNNRKFRY